MTLVGTLLEKQVRLYSTKDRYAFDDTINSKVLCFAFGLVAEIERNLISMRTREALTLRREQGIALGRRKGSYTKLRQLIDDRREVVRLLDDGIALTDLCARYGVSRTTFCRFRDQFLCVSLCGGRKIYRLREEVSDS